MKAILFFFLIIYFTTCMNAQTCGFGCLGLSGFFAGYSAQFYKPEGLNQYVENRIYGPNQTSIDNHPEFSLLKGFKFGANIFRAKFSSFFLSAKGFYQYLKESKNVKSKIATGEIDAEYEVKLNYYGAAFDFGFPIIGGLDLKILEAGLIMQTSNFHSFIKLNDEVVEDKTFINYERKINYYLGAGLIYQLIPNYISLEATTSYNFFDEGKMIDYKNEFMKNEKENKEIDKMIAAGGLNYAIQLNFGLPL